MNYSYQVKCTLCGAQVKNDPHSSLDELWSQIQHKPVTGKNDWAIGLPCIEAVFEGVLVVEYRQFREE